MRPSINVMNEDKGRFCSFEVLGLWKRWGEILKTKAWSDCTFVIGPQQKQFACHKLVLLTSSKVFVNMLSGPNAARGPIHLPEFNPSAFQELLRFAYTDQMTLRTLKQAIALCRVSSFFEMKTVVKACEMYMMDELYPDELVHLFLFACELNLTDLKQSSINVLIDCTDSILENPSFVNASHEFIMILLSKDSLAISNEGKLADAIVRWAKAQTGTYQDQLIKFGKSDNNPPQDSSEEQPGSSGTAKSTTSKKGTKKQKNKTKTKASISAETIGTVPAVEPIDAAVLASVAPTDTVAVSEEKSSTPTEKSASPTVSSPFRLPLPPIPKTIRKSAGSVPIHENEENCSQKSNGVKPKIPKQLPKTLKRQLNKMRDPKYVANIKVASSRKGKQQIKNMVPENALVGKVDIELRKTLGPALKLIRFLAPSLNFNKFLADHPEVLTEEEVLAIKGSKFAYKLAMKQPNDSAVKKHKNHKHHDDWNNHYNAAVLYNERLQVANPLPGGLYNQYRERTKLELRIYERDPDDNEAAHVRLDRVE